MVTMINQVETLNEEAYIIENNQAQREGGSCLGAHVRIKDFKIKKNKKLKKK